MSENSKINVIKGIGILNILSEKENEMLKKTDVIKGIGIVLIRDNFYSNYPNISLKSIGNTIMVPGNADVALEMGVITVNQGYLEAVADKIHIVSLGAIIVAPDTDPKMFAQKISAIHSMGAVICPEALLGAVSSRLNSQMSVVLTYPDDSTASAIFHNGTMALSREYVQSLNENTVLLVNGRLDILEPLDEQLLKSRILHMVINGKCTINQNSHRTLSAKTTINGCTVIVPEGYEYVKGNITFDKNNLSKYAGKNIFCPETAYFDATLTPREIEENHFGLICTQAVLPAELERAVSSVLKDKECDKIVYSGKLLINQGTRKITTKELNYSNVPLHIINYGDIRFEENIDDDIFNEKVLGLHNYGAVVCSEELYGLVQVKMIQNEGSLETFEEAAKVTESNEIVLLSGLGKVDL